MSNVAESLRTAAEALLDAAEKLAADAPPFVEAQYSQGDGVYTPWGQTRPIYETTYKGVHREIVPLTWKKGKGGDVRVVVLELSRGWVTHPKPVIKTFIAGDLHLWDPGRTYTFPEAS